MRLRETIIWAGSREGVLKSWEVRKRADDPQPSDLLRPAKRPSRMDRPARTHPGRAVFPRPKPVYAPLRQVPGSPEDWTLKRPSQMQAPFFSLELTRPTGAPVIFQNDDKTQYHWTSDDHLIVEELEDSEEDSATGMGKRTVYSISKKNIRYWGPEESSPTYMRRMGRSPKYDRPMIMAAKRVLARYKIQEERRGQVKRTV